MKYLALGITVFASALPVACRHAATAAPVEETMHDDLIKRCYALAESAIEHGNHPFGALLMKDGEVILEAENTVVTEKDITGHAELNLVRMAGKRFDRETLAQSTLYTSTEPCIMCLGSIYWAGIPKIVYGVSGSSLADLGDGGWYISSRDTGGRLRPKIDVTGPIHKRFW
jgi:tRNA(Arg) A34 adenosine deaminase TadA